MIRARAQDPIQALPDNYHLLLENRYLRVVHVTYRAHEKLPVHNHSDKPTVYVYLTDSGPVRFSHVEAPSFQLVRRPVKAGTFRISPGRLEKHEVENLGDSVTEFLRVELKEVPLGLKKIVFRSPISIDPAKSGVTTEFPGPFIKIRRIITPPHETTEIGGSTEPGILIPFSSIKAGFATEGTRPRTVKRGEVLWIDAHSTCRVAGPDDNASAHMLQILFLLKN
jgi:quercetin dioxygenase-like cupin family protein